VAVAHFDNDTGSAAYDSLAAGLTDSLIAELAAAGPGRFEVIGNASPLREPKAIRDLLAIGTSLKASYVIPGRILRDSNLVQAVVSLITLPEKTHVRLARVDVDANNLFNSQIVAARSIAATFLGLWVAKSSFLP
jgi:TolB-like protein